MPTFIDMPKRERARRMRALRKRVLTYDVRRWSATFFDALKHVTAQDDYGRHEDAQTASSVPGSVEPSES